MRRRSILWAVAGLVLSVAGCAQTPTGWRHFQGELSGQGFLNVKSGYAVSPAWKSEPLAVASSSPVVGRDPLGAEVVYAGTVDARLAAVDAASGEVRWRRYLGAGEGRSSIVASPTVGEDGSVLVLTTTELAGGRLQSSLHKVDALGIRRWSFALPDGGVSLGSPKAFTFAGQPLALVQFLTGDSGGLRSELMVVRDVGAGAELMSRRSLGDCPDKGASHARMLKTWELLTAWPSTPGADPADVVFNPSPAAKPNRSKLLIAMADNLCRVGVFEWDGRELSRLWDDAHPGTTHSSPAILSNNLVVFGRRDGKLLAYDAETGVRMWEYDAGEPLLSTPSVSAGGVVFAVSRTHLFAVQAGDGAAARQSGAPQRLKILGPTIASPAVTADCVYLPTREMLTVSHDFKVRSHNTTFVGNGLSSAAVGSDGSLYVAAADGSIWKYK
jgi:outer membrane protein assembly factor BamB